MFPQQSGGRLPIRPRARIGSNDLKGASGPLTVGNIKSIYIDLLEYFKTKQDKLFVLVVSPPLRKADTDSGNAANARYLADWLVDPNGWLKSYPYANVVAWDYFTVLTGGIHSASSGRITHSAGSSNYLAYPTGDSHPSEAGQARAAGQFAPWLNAAYRAFKAGEKLPAAQGAAVASTSITIKTSAASTRIGRTPILSGNVTPARMLGRTIAVYVRKPGSTRWSMSSYRPVYSSAGRTTWRYPYYFKRGMRKGVYRFKATVPARTGFLTSTSREITIRLR